jgi:hypothetical protein
VSPREIKIKAQKRHLVETILKGRDHASSASLSASYGLELAEVQTIMRREGVKDDG